MPKFAKLVKPLFSISRMPETRRLKADATWRKSFKHRLREMVSDTWGSIQQALDERVAEKTLYKWCSDKEATLPRADDLMELCAAAGYTTRWLLTGGGSPKIEQVLTTQSLEEELAREVKRRLTAEGIASDVCDLINAPRLLNVTTGIAKRYLEPYQLLRAAHDAMLESVTALYDDRLAGSRRANLIRQLERAGLGLFDVLDSLPTPAESGVLNVVARQMRKPKAAKRSRRAKERAGR